ncbi:MAG TPA: nucleotidyltransferase family protein [Acidobacteriaceae bacterium]
MTVAGACLAQAGSEEIGAPEGIDERQLLLRCVRRAFEPGDAPPFSVPAGVQWPRLLELAQKHRVVTFLQRGLQGADGVPEPARLWIQQYCRRSVAHNLALVTEMGAVMDALAAAGVAAVPFKGPVWTKMLYGNLADREIADLDFFVDRADMGRASRVLRDRSYGVPPVGSIDPAAWKDLTFVHPESGIEIELHWAACETSRDARLATLRLWEPAGTASVLDRDFPAPLPENMLFLLAIHGYRDKWRSLKWICDIAAMLHAFPDLDWPHVFREAGKVSRRRVILVPLALVERLLGITLPQAAAEALARDRGVLRIAEQIERRSYRAGGERMESTSLTGRGRMYLEWYRIRHCDSVWERTRRQTKLLVQLLEPNDEDRARLGGRLPRSFAWLMRPWRLIRAYGLSGALGMSRRFASRSSYQGTRDSR